MNEAIFTYSSIELGGLTTFSAFALEFSHLTDKHLINEAMSYIILSVVLSLVAFFISAKIARLI